jgi:hypothetical protein
MSKELDVSTLTWSPNPGPVSFDPVDRLAMLAVRHGMRLVPRDRIKTYSGKHSADQLHGMSRHALNHFIIQNISHAIAEKLMEHNKVLIEKKSAEDGRVFWYYRIDVIVPHTSPTEDDMDAGYRRMLK